MIAKSANLRWRLLGMMLPLTCVAAPPAEAPPPADFWQFYNEFADDRGELLDPTELDSLAANGIDASGLDALAKMPVTEIPPDSATEEETP